MKISKYKWNDKEFLIYSLEDKTLPEDIEEIQYVSDIPDVNSLESNWMIPIYNFNDFMMLFLPNKFNTRDKQLEQNNVTTFADLECEYCLIRYNKSNLSKHLRDLVIEKYSEIINNI